MKDEESSSSGFGDDQKPSKGKQKLEKSSVGKKRKEQTGFTENLLNEIRELFESVYVVNKWKIVRMNFLRGIGFGLGTFLGGTIVVALVAWILTQTVDLFPWAHEFTQRLLDSLQK